MTQYNGPPPSAGNDAHLRRDTMQKKVSFGRDGIIAMTSSKSYAPVGFIRNCGSDYVAYMFKIENGFAKYGSKTNNIDHAIATGTVISSKKRKNIADQVAALYADSFVKAGE